VKQKPIENDARRVRVLGWKISKGKVNREGEKKRRVSFNRKQRGRSWGQQSFGERGGIQFPDKVPTRKSSEALVRPGTTGFIQERKPRRELGGRQVTEREKVGIKDKGQVLTS